MKTELRLIDREHSLSAKSRGKNSKNQKEKRLRMDALLRSILGPLGRLKSRSIKRKESFDFKAEEKSLNGERLIQSEANRQGTRERMSVRVPSWCPLD